MTNLTMKLRGGTEKTIEVNSFTYTRMNGIYKFALHKSGKDWILSEFKFGAKVCKVLSYYKGCPVSSGNLTLKQARIMALHSIDLLVDRIGFDAFDSAINDPKPF